MPRKKLILFVLGCTLASAQESKPSSTPATGSISGVVRADGSGEPLPDVNLFLSPGSQRTTSDSQGKYSYGGLAAGTYSISTHTSHDRDAPARRTVALSAGQELSSVDFHLKSTGSIQGTVLDQNKEPLPGITVFLVAREYSFGAIRYTFARVAKTNDKGEYRLEGVTPGRGYLIWAKKWDLKLNAISDAPADLKLRKRIAAATFYPGSPAPEGAEIITVRAGEHREGVDLRLWRSASYCIEGVLDAGNGPAALNFDISERQPSGGVTRSGGVFMTPPFGTSGTDGRFRICDLAPGEYHLAAAENPFDPKIGPVFYGATEVPVTDGDVRKIRVPMLAKIPVPGRVVWDGKPPDSLIDAPLQFSLTPLTRPPFMGEIEGLLASSSVPGEFSFPGLLMDDYGKRIWGLPKDSDVYIKDVTYAGSSILYQSLRIGTQLGTPDLRVVLAHDGGHIKLKLADKDGNPVPDASVWIMPASAPSEAVLAEAMIFGQADQNASYSSEALAPGKYYVLAGTVPTDPTPEAMDNFWTERTRSTEVDLPPDTTVEATVVPR